MSTAANYAFIKLKIGIFTQHKFTFYLGCCFGGATTLIMTTLSMTTFSITTLSVRGLKVTLSITTLRITTLSTITVIIRSISINDNQLDNTLLLY
jgi:hypothetical protein